MVYHSRRNPLVLVLMIFALVSLILAGFAWVAVGLAVSLVLFGIPKHYELEGNALVVRSGFIRKRYAYKRILTVEMEEDPGGSDGNGSSILLHLENDSQIRLMPRNVGALRDALEERVLAVRGERV